MATVAAGMLVENAAVFLFGKEPRGMPSALAQHPIMLFGVGVLPLHIVILLVGLGLAGLFLLVTRVTPHGKALLAVVQNPRAAQLMGIDSTKVTTFAYALSSASAGLAGILVAPLTHVAADMGFVFGIKGFAAAILGGLDSPWGVVLAGLFLGLAEASVTAFVGSGATVLMSFGLVILALGRSPGRFTLAELATAAGLYRAAARRVLLTLMELGYCRSEGRYFRLTPRTLGLGLSFLNGLPFWGYAQQVLEELREEIGESCAMAILDGADILYILRLPARRILATNLGIGSRLPAHAVSLGRVLLAGLPPEELDAYLARSNRQAFTRRTITDAAALRSELARVRDQGYAWVEAELDPAICGLSVPVRDSAREVVAAISVNAIAGSLSEAEAKERLLVPLRRAAEEIRTRSRL